MTRSRLITVTFAITVLMLIAAGPFTAHSGGLSKVPGDYLWTVGKTFRYKVERDGQDQGHGMEVQVREVQEDGLVFIECTATEYRSGVEVLSWKWKYGRKLEGPVLIEAVRSDQFKLVFDPPAYIFAPEIKVGATRKGITKMIYETPDGNTVKGMEVRELRIEKEATCETPAGKFKGFMVDYVYTSYKGAVMRTRTDCIAPGMFFLRRQNSDPKSGEEVVYTLVSVEN